MSKLKLFYIDTLKMFTDTKNYEKIILGVIQQRMNKNNKKMRTILLN